MSSADTRSAAAEDLLRTNNNNNTTVVHVRGDSETELDLLFSVLNNNEPKRHPTGQAYRNKNLPLSFFRPPRPRPGGGHSREVSLDYDSAGNSVETGVYHSRSHSSPAKLPISLSLAPVDVKFEHLKNGFIDRTSSRYVSK